MTEEKPSKYRLYLIRGIPGSGKTTFAKSLNLKYHFEADMFFEADGDYIFNRDGLADAHRWCQNKTEEAMKANDGDIVVSNTFVRRWELSTYLNLAEKYGFTVHVRTMTGNYKSVHDVPESTIQMMKENFQP